MAKAMEKVVIKKDVNLFFKLPNIVGHVKMEEVDAAKNDTNEDSLVPSTQSLDAKQEEDEDQNGVDFAGNMSLQQNQQGCGLVIKHLAG
jgi:hypothetical protein